MHTLRRHILLKTYELFDLVSMIGWFAAAAGFVSYLTYSLTFADFVAMRIKPQNFAIFMGFIFVWHMTLRAFGLYHSGRVSLPLSHGASSPHCFSSGSQDSGS